MRHLSGGHGAVIPWLPHDARAAMATLRDPCASAVATALAASIVEIAVRRQVERLGFVPEPWLQLVAGALTASKLAHGDVNDEESP